MNADCGTPKPVITNGIVVVADIPDSAACVGPLRPGDGEPAAFISIFVAGSSTHTPENPALSVENSAILHRRVVLEPRPVELFVTSTDFSSHAAIASILAMRDVVGWVVHIALLPVHQSRLSYQLLVLRLAKIFQRTCPSLP